MQSRQITMFKKVVRKLLFVFWALSLLMMTGIISVAAQQRIVVYSPPNEEHTMLVMQAFERQTGIKVDYVRISAGEVLARVRAEAANPQADVWWGGSADGHISAKGEGFLVPYESPLSAPIPAEFKDDEHYWSGIYLATLCFAVNDEELNRIGVEAPQTWDDLLDSRLKGLISMPDPNTSGTAYGVLSTIVQMRGEDAAFDYLLALHQNIHQYTRSGIAPIQQASLGEVAVAVVYDVNARQFIQEGHPLRVIYPSDGTGFEVGGVSIIKNGPNGMEVAKKFVDFALKKETMEMGLEAGIPYLLPHPEARIHELAVPLENVKVIPFDFGWSGANKVRLLEKWNSSVY